MTERQGIEIDYCPKCRGVWLDKGELDKIIERSVALEQDLLKQKMQQQQPPQAPQQQQTPPQSPYQQQPFQQPQYQQPPQYNNQPHYQKHHDHHSHNDHYYHKKKHKSMWDELFDFD
jgi:hypothetical protein